MDNNPINQPQPIMPQPPIPQPQTPPNIMQTPNMGDEPKSSKGLILMIMIGVVMTIVLIGGAYFYVSQNKQPETVPSPTTVVDNLEGELNRVEIDNLEEEFATVEADLQSL